MQRVNFLSSPNRARQFIEAVAILKDPPQSPWPGQQGLSVYDFFVYWHFRSMMIFTPPQQQDRNAAHSGPAFLPWHRYMLLAFEQQLRQVLQDDTFRLPYWEWTSDAALPDPAQSPIWASSLLGRFVEDTWRVRLQDTGQGTVMMVDRPLARSLGAEGQLPASAEVRAIVRDQVLYDTAPFDSSSQGFRNLLEGWIGSTRVHNNVHVWVGGDMGLATSPNDPVFFLHHCNIDRIWAAWQSLHQTAVQYVPDQSAPEELALHRIDDPMFTLFDETVTSRAMLDHSTLYSYDTLEDLVTA